MRQKHIKTQTSTSIRTLVGRNSSNEMHRWEVTKLCSGSEPARPLQALGALARAISVVGSYCCLQWLRLELQLVRAPARAASCDRERRWKESRRTWQGSRLRVFLVFLYSGWLNKI